MTRQPDLSTLSVKQHEIIRLVAKRLDDEAIARQLSLSPRTVSAHKQTMVVTLGLNNSDELARVAEKIFL